MHTNFDSLNSDDLDVVYETTYIDRRHSIDENINHKSCYLRNIMMNSVSNKDIILHAQFRHKVVMHHR